MHASSRSAITLFLDEYIQSGKKLAKIGVHHSGI